LWRLLRTLKIPGAFFAGLLFLVHPVNVESVAWITERKNTLAMLFYLLSLWLYVHSRNAPGKAKKLYGMSLAAFALALLSKTSVVMLPFVLLLIEWWQHQKVTRADVLRVLPFFSLSLAMGLVTIWFQYHRAIAGDIIHDRSLLARLAAAGWAVWFYLAKAIWPDNLCFAYADWNGNERSLAAFLPGLGLIALVILLWRVRQTRARAVLFAMAYFTVMLFPVLGFFKVYFQRYSLVTDHWQYFSLIGIVALVAATLSPKAMAQKGSSDGAQFGFVFLRCSLVVMLAMLSFRQTRAYANAESLWLETLRKNPQCWLALNNLGLILDGAGKPQDAIPLFERSLQIKPQQVEGYNNLGTALLDQGRYAEALEKYQQALKVDPLSATSHYNIANALDRMGQSPPGTPGHDKIFAEYREALRLNPQYVEAMNNLACGIAQEGKLDEAVQQLRQAVALNPDYADGLSNLGSLLTQQGHPVEAAPFLQRAVLISPNHADAHHNFGNALMALGKTAEAIDQFSQAVAINPQMVLAHYNLANALLSVGQARPALEHFSTILQLQPGHAESHYQMAVILQANNQTKDAVAHFQAATQLKPEWLEPINQLAWIHATHKSALYRDGDEAIRLAKHAVELTHTNSAAVLDTLAAAYAQNGEFEKAITIAEKAIALAERTEAKPSSAKPSATIPDPQQILAEQIRKRLALYQAGKPFRE
jgi:tetratricopeptide (TPR) repeat protein